MTPLTRRPARGVLATALALAVIGVLALLPDLGPGVAPGAAAIEADRGRIEALTTPAGDSAAAASGARVRILDGPRAGQVLDADLQGPGGSELVAGYRVGDDVVVTITRQPSGEPYVSVADHWRLPWLLLLGLLFAAAVVLVGGWRGMRALVALGLTIAVILKVLVPLVIGGAPPVPLAVITATVVTVATIVLTEGVGRTSVAAILGTAGALVLCGVLGLAGTSLASFTYTAGSELAFLQTSGGSGIDLRGLLLAAFILGAVGVLGDVTVTQAAIVDSLAAGGATGGALARAALGVGRSHIAATVNMLFLAYVGAGLPLLVTIVVSQQPAAVVLNSEEVATEIIRTIVGSLGIVVAVPLTTLFAVIAVRPWEPRLAGRLQSIDPRGPILIGATTLIALALIGTAIVPIGSVRSPLPNDAINPQPPSAASVSPGPRSTPGAPSIAPGTSGAAAGSPATPPVLALHEDFGLTEYSATVDVQVTELKATATPKGTRVLIDVAYHDDGPGPFSVDPHAWSLIAVDGTEVFFSATSSGGLAATSLVTGSSAQGSLVATAAATPDNLFVAYTDSTGTLEFLVPATAK